MKKRVYKYPLNPNNNSINMPIGAEILTVQTQNNTPFIWALVNPENDAETRYFEVYGTGHDIHYDMGIDRKYINTFQLDGGALVFHLFERIN